MKLKTGITTGTCAAACTYAAVYNLIDEYQESAVPVTLPDGKVISVILEKAYCEDGISWCFVRKDSGDDPDITNGTLIGASVRKVDAEEKEPCFEDDLFILKGGKGIGRVTKNGLACPIGYPAINPVPREMIFQSARNALTDLGFYEDYEEHNIRLEITITIPDGEELALKTFNPNLGIVGGLSVLGTSGIVNPMSEDAIIETIRLDIRTKVCEGRKTLVMIPGNYGEDFLKNNYDLNSADFVKCSNYVGKTIEMMAEEGVQKLLFTGHIGKLIKVAGGIMNTHSKYGDHRMEMMYQLLCEVAPIYKSAEYSELILHMNTTDEACEYLEKLGLLDKVMAKAAANVKSNIEKNIDNKEFQCEVVLFNKIQGELAKTEKADEFINCFKEEA